MTTITDEWDDVAKAEWILRNNWDESQVSRIFETPDKGKTIYVRLDGVPPWVDPERTIIHW